MKGLVIGHKKNGVQVMDRNGYFHFVRGFIGWPLGSEIEMPDEHEDEVEPTRLRGVVFPRPEFTRRMALAGFAAACICVICFFAGRWSQVAYYVEFDGIADIELAFNKMGIVKSVTGINSEGTELLTQERLVGRGKEAIGMALMAVEESGAHMANMTNSISVLKSGGTQFIEVTIIARNVEQAMSICTDISQYLVDSYGEIVIDVDCCDATKRDIAMEMCVSVGKLLLAEHLHDKEPEVSMEEIVLMPVGGIFNDLHAGGVVYQF